MEEAIKIIQERYRIIGREEELERALTAAYAKKHILFEGAVGVGKTVIAMALANYLNRQFYRVDGDERYTEMKLTGWFDPPSVMAKGYSWETFIPGPLTEAMVKGAFLFINELNRMPEGTQNVLLPAMDEKQIIVPKIGAVKANSGFLIIATQNPEEFVGTSRLGEALKDRFVWIHLDYQPEDEEQKIVQKETRCDNGRIIAIAVKIARKTREDPEIRRGASVRGAIDIVDLVSHLSRDFTSDLNVWTKAAVSALATKIELQDQATQKTENIVRKIVKSVLDEYFKSVGGQGTTNITETEKGQTDTKQFKDLQSMKMAFQNGDFQTMISLIKQTPNSIYQIFCEEGLLERVLLTAEKTESKWLPIQLLYLIQSMAPDPTRKRVARKILIRMILRLAAQITGKGIGATKYVDAQFKPSLEEFDLEQTLENQLGKRRLDYQDIVCIERIQTKSAVSLILDASNSMQREKIIIAALIVGVLAYKLRDDYYSVITFNDYAQIVKPITEDFEMEKLISKMLDLQPGGLTNIKEALEKGLEELDKLQMHERVGILVTDGWATKGGDPVMIAEKYPRLHVVQVPLGIGGGDSNMCMNLAKAGRGRYSHMRNFYQLPRAIMHVLR
jgi:MoxR-like ATPase